MLLVHVAGVADLGINLIVNGKNRPQEETAELTESRVTQLLACEEGAQATDLLLRLRFVASDCIGGNPDSASPLHKELMALERLVTKRDTSLVKILVVGIKGGGTPTEPTAQAIVHALGLASTQISEAVCGKQVEVLDPCILPSLSVQPESVQILERLIGGHDGHVLLALGGGSNAVFAEVAGVVSATHPDDWSLALIDRAGENHPGGESSFIDMSVKEDPLRGWLMGLGLPTVLAYEYERRSESSPEEVCRAAKAIRRAVGDQVIKPQSEDFAQLLWTDIARGDLAAGMALRAWVVAEYRRRLDEYRGKMGLTPGQHPDATLDSRGKTKMVGKAISCLETKAKPQHLAAPEDWLIRQRDLVDEGIKATHEFGMVPEALRAKLNRSLGKRPDWLSWPSGNVCLLSGQGASRSGRQPRAPIAVTLLKAEPPRVLRRACSTDTPLTLETLIACSETTEKDGKRVVKELSDDSFSRNEGWCPVGDGATAGCYGAPTTRNGVLAADAAAGMERVIQLAEEWLEGRPSRPRVVVTTVLGEKPVVVALLRAAQAFGARHGVPVFLMSSVKEEDRECLQFHQFGLDRDVRVALLRATEHCLDRFDLLTASRLLTLGDPVMDKFAVEALALSDELVKVVQTQDLDASASTVLSIMHAVGGRINDVQPDAQARLATIVGELLHLPPKQKQSESFRKPKVLALADGRFDAGKPYKSHSADLHSESADRLLRLLVRVRNVVPVNHGELSLRDATMHVLRHYGQGSSCSYAQLIERAVAAVSNTHGVAADDWADRFDQLRSQVAKLRDSAYGEES